MTMTYSGPATMQREEKLKIALRAAHEVWIQEASSYLTPVIEANASFWERWTAVRYLADQFLAQFQRERSLIDELRPLLRPEAVERLDRDAQRIAERLEYLDRLGRRRSTAHTVGVAARALLHSLRAWCDEIENTAGRLPRQLLPERVTGLLADLELYTEVHA